MILAIRTNKPEAELCLLDDQGRQVAQKIWLADRRLSQTLLAEIIELLGSQKLEIKDLIGLVAYQGPGSFTGLRIGLSVVNALAYAEQIPVVGASGEDWLTQGFSRLKDLPKDKATRIFPEYGAEANITQPKK